MTHNLSVRVKRLKYRTSHTGTKETDILLGGFIDLYGESLTLAEVDGIESLLAYGNDPKVFNWIVGQEKIPENFDIPIVKRIARFVVERKR